jgi:hypothetical protein
LTEDDIEVEYRPIRKIVILNIEELDKEELFERASAIRMGGQPLFLSWAEGIVFIAEPASPDITEVDENIVKGVAYFAGVTYSLMPKYQPLVQVGADKIPIIDQSKSLIFKSIAEWIIKRKNR